MKQINYVALAAAGIAAVSVFLPWLEPSGTSSFGEYSSSYSLGKIPGISLGYGGIGLAMAVVGGFMAFKRIKWAFVAGVINVIDGLGYLLGWFNASAQSNYSINSSFGNASASASIDPQFGLYLFVIASVVFVLFTIKDVKKEDLQQIDTI
jgi:hypothetical protein